MNNEEQKKVFARNLNYYISLNGKQQNEFAKEIGENATTVNMWCTGNSLPRMGKVQKIAEYFGIDTLLVRIAFVVFTVIGSLSFWVYLLLWLLAPKSK